MSLLLALFLVVHGGIHIGFLCSRSWPFTATDPWLVSGLGAGSDTVNAVATALVLVTFLAYLFAALSAAGMVVPSRFFAPLVVVASLASALVLVVFVAPGTVPGLVVDGVLLWATLARGWHPALFFGRTDGGHGGRDQVTSAR